MPPKQAIQSSILSLQNDVPFLLGRRVASTASASSTRPATATAINNLDEIATTALRAKALEKSEASASLAPTAAAEKKQTSAPETFSTWRATKPQYWSDGMIRPVSQGTRSTPSPHWSILPSHEVVENKQRP